MKKLYVLCFVLLVACVSDVKAQFKNLYTFDSAAYTYSSLTISGNRMFGVAYEGGPIGKGFFFGINRDGSGYKIILNCEDTGATAGNSTGYYPYGNVTAVKNKIYGFEYEGGAYGAGLIFRVDSNGGGYKDLYDFTSATGEYLGWGALTMVGNKFFGMTYEGGASGYGVVFSVDTDGANYRDLHDFTSTGNDGGSPEDVQLVFSGHKLFGMTVQGGAGDSGVIFSIDTNGLNYKDLHDMTLATGYGPEGHLIMFGNKLYGLTYYGGANDSGAAFSLDTNGAGFKLLYSFNNASGYFPWGSFTVGRNKLYAMTYYGGAHDTGNIFEMDTNGANFKDLFDFSRPNGAFPYGNNLTLEGDTLFGMTDAGGIGYGNIFRYIDTNVTTGVENLQVNGTVVLYPNPNEGNFTIQQKGAVTKNSVEVYNTLGQMVYAHALNNNTTQINLANQAKGIYLYRIITEQGALVSEGKLVIE